MSFRPIKIAVFFASLVLCCQTGSRVDAEGHADTEDTEQAYRLAIAGRAERIVGPLGIQEKDKSSRVAELVAGQYFALRKIHDVRDEKLSREAVNLKDQESLLAEARNQINQQAAIEQFRLHREFVARLTVELNAEQVEGVKNGMTYGVVPVTYARYLKLLPDLNQAEQQQIYAWLIEAREYAMDGGSSEEKHGWFRKYKGKINNFLSAHGYDLSAAEMRASK